MLDSLAICLPGAQVDPEALRGIRPLTSGEGFQGELGNLRVVQGARAAWLEGSLPRYLNGDNGLTATREDLREALRKLETESGLDLRLGFVYRMETAATLPVREPPRSYLAAWGPLGRFHKDIYGDGRTVLYRTGARSFTGYDKGVELGPVALPEPLKGRCALRLELRHKRALKRVLGRQLSPWELLEPEPYREAVERWKRFYLSIPKKKEVYLVMEGMTAKGMERTLAALGLQAYGLDRFYAQIKDAQNLKRIDRTTATRMRQLIREIEKDKRILDAEPLTAEVDEKVMAVARFAR